MPRDTCIDEHVTQCTTWQVAASSWYQVPHPRTSASDLIRNDDDSGRVEQGRWYRLGSTACSPFRWLQEEPLSLILEAASEWQG
jgi:hypothetical protein